MFQKKWDKAFIFRAKPWISLSVWYYTNKSIAIKHTTVDTSIAVFDPTLSTSGISRIELESPPPSAQVSGANQLSKR
jgi:hypothetical protein